LPQNAIALLNYLKRIAPQQLKLRTQVFTKNFSERKELKRKCKNNIQKLKSSNNY
jgi:hypothetical protein